MKCLECGKKFFKDVIDKDGVMSGIRMCRNCGTINFSGYKKYKFKRGVFEYDFEN